MSCVMAGTMNIEDEAAHVAEQDDDTTDIYKLSQQVQVCGDDAHTKILSGLLVAGMTLLFDEVVGGDALYVVEDVQNGVAKELRENQGTDDDTKFSGSQTLNLWWVWNGALV